jgi:hypothetical protein
VFSSGEKDYAYGYNIGTILLVSKGLGKREHWQRVSSIDAKGRTWRCAVSDVQLATQV